LTTLKFLFLFLKVYLGVILIFYLLIVINALITGELNELTLENLFGLETLKILAGFSLPTGFCVEGAIQYRMRHPKKK
jgi:hypothetical protein